MYILIHLDFILNSILKNISLKKSIIDGIWHKTALGSFIRRLKVTKGIPKAITATARKLACLFYRLLKFGQEYVEQGMDYYEKKYQERVIKTLQKKAKELGYSLQQNQGVVRGVS